MAVDVLTFIVLTGNHKQCCILIHILLQILGVPFAGGRGGRGGERVREREILCCLSVMFS
jgi:hypothetical protein